MKFEANKQFMGNLSLHLLFSFIFVKILISTALEDCVVSL